MESRCPVTSSPFWRRRWRDLPSFLAAKPTGPFKLSAFSPSSLVPFLLSAFTVSASPRQGKEDFRQPLQTPPALRSRVKGRIAARAEKHRPGRRLPISAFSFQNFSFSAWHMNPALHDNPWIDCGTSLLWDAAALIRRLPLVWCTQIGFQSPV